MQKALKNGVSSCAKIYFTKMINLSEEHTVKYIFNLGVEKEEVRKHFSYRTQKALSVKTTIAPPQRKQ